jgi:MFS family permease
MPSNRTQSLWAISLLLIASALPLMQAGLVAPALPAINDAFSKTSNAEFLARLVLVAPTISIIILAPFAGMLADRIERSGMLAVALLVYGLSGVGAFLAQTIEQLIAVRLVLGCAIAVAMTVTSLLVGSYFEGNERERIFGAQGATRGLAGAVFPLVGGVLATLDWRYVFVVQAVVLLFFPIALCLPASRAVPVAKTGNDEGFGYGVTATICALMFFGMLVMYLLTTQIAFHFKELDLPSPSVAGLAIGVSSLAGALCALSYTRLRKRMAPPDVAALSCGLMWIGYCIVGLGSSLYAIIAGLTIAGCGFGLQFPNCMTWLMSCVPANFRGKASAALTSAMFAGQFASPFVYSPLVARFGSASTFLLTAWACFLVAATLFGGQRLGRSNAASLERS